MPDLSDLLRHEIDRHADASLSIPQAWAPAPGARDDTGDTALLEDAQPPADAAEATAMGARDWMFTMEADVGVQEPGAFHAEVLFQGRLMCRMVLAGGGRTREHAEQALRERGASWRAEYEARRSVASEADAPAGDTS